MTLLLLILSVIGIGLVFQAGIWRGKFLYHKRIQQLMRLSDEAETLGLKGEEFYLYINERINK